MIVSKPRLPLKWMLTFGLLPSRLKIFIYTLKGARIGPGVQLGFGSVILARESIEIGAGASIGMFSAIDAKQVKIGKRSAIRSFVLIEATDVLLGDDVRISESALIRTFVASPMSRIIVRDRAHIFPFSMIDVTREVHIGEESSVGYGTYIFTHGAYKSKLDGYPVVFDRVHIGRGAWIPSRVFIMPSVRIGDDAVIGTGALVNRDVPDGALAAGVPAKIVKTREQYVVSYTESERLKILTEILDEFCQYLQEYARMSVQVEDGDGRRCWTLTPRRGRRRFQLELAATPSAAREAWASVVLQPVPESMQRTWDGRRKTWFSIGSKRCSEHLDAFGEELREFCRRYGIYFARP